MTRLPRLVGWMGARHPFDFDPLTIRLADDARRFMLSTMSCVSAIGLGSSIAMLPSLGFERIDQHARRLATHLVDRVIGDLPIGRRDGVTEEMPSENEQEQITHARTSRSS